jgi:hypothetical protein
MLIAPLIAALMISLSFTMNIKQNTVLTDEQKATLNGYVDWENSIFLLVKSDEVRSNF